MSDIRKQVEEIMMDFVGAYESFDEIPEARSEALTKLEALIQEQVRLSKQELVDIAAQRAKDDEDYQLWAFAEDMQEYLDRTKLKGEK